MTFRASLALAALIPAGMALAEAHAPAQDQIDAFVAAVVANGCVINGETAGAIMAAAAMDGPTAESIMDFLGEAGEAPDAAIKLTRNEDGSITMQAEGCPAE